MVLLLQCTLSMTLRSGLVSVLFWSVIAAAFIGPGTVTTAASAGARFDLALLWALVFSTGACLVLQEASARITVASGSNLGQALVRQYPGGVGRAVPLVVMGTIVLGCAAYEAGNILGAAAGLQLVTGVPPRAAALAIGSAACAILWIGSTRAVVTALGFVVAVLGVSFLSVAATLRPEAAALLGGSLVPSWPDGSGLLVLALVGTTIVPYNLFLGSGLAHGHSIGEMRFGLTMAVVLGGIISMGILVVGTATDGTFSYPALAEALSIRVGDGGRWLLGTGLFAAGASSAMTAPLAAAITVRSVLGGTDRAAWHDRSRRYRSVWAGVLLTGVAFGTADVQPIPAIIAAQALNGVVLPFVAVYLLIAVNDRALMGARGLNGAARGHPMKRLVMFTALALIAVHGAGTRTADAQGQPERVRLPSTDGRLNIIAFGAHPDDCDIRAGGTARSSRRSATACGSSP
jgi:manganese transport protein